MIQNKKKVCKATARARGFETCGDEKYLVRFGLCQSCFSKWLLSTDEGDLYLNKQTAYSKKKVSQERKKQRKIEHKKDKLSVKKFGELKTLLQIEINTIVRLLDSGKGCISCNHGWSGDFTMQKNASHYHNVGSNDTIRFHLDNIHTSCVKCNKHDEGNKPEYYNTLVSLYSQEYANHVRGLNSKYSTIKLDRATIVETIPIARKIVRELVKGSEYTREEINNILDIYKKN